MTGNPKLPTLVFVCAALAAASAPAPAAEPLGRLFFTPDQRVSLDAARSKKARVNLATETEATEKPPAPPAPEVVTYGGVVRRSDGKATVWLNDRPVDGKDARAGAIVGRVRPDGSVTVQSAQSGRSVDLRVGQRAELLSGKVEEGYATRGVASKPDTSLAAKPGADAGAGATSADKEKEETARRDRERRRDLDDAIRALEAASARPASPPPAETQAPQPQSPYPPSR